MECLPAEVKGRMPRLGEPSSSGSPAPLKRESLAGVSGHALVSCVGTLFIPSVI